MHQQQKDSFVNLSSIEIDTNIKNILSLALNSHLKQNIYMKIYKKLKKVQNCVQVQRFTQLFTNNNFPMKLIETTVEQFLNKKLEPQQPVIQDLNTITFFFQNQMSSSYKGEERKLKEMIQKHVPPNENYSVKLLSKLFHQTSY